VAVGDGLELAVHDDGVRPGDAPRDPADVGGGTGLGLVSMRERVESLGGSFEAGAATGGLDGGGPNGDGPDGGGSDGDGGRADGQGWRVRAVLPLPDRAPAEPASSDRTIPGIHA
jgi:hypothetical protein